MEQNHDVESLGNLLFFFTCALPSYSGSPACLRNECEYNHSGDSVCVNIQHPCSSKTRSSGRERLRLAVTSLLTRHGLHHVAYFSVSPVQLPSGPRAGIRLSIFAGEHPLLVKHNEDAVDKKWWVSKMVRRSGAWIRSTRTAESCLYVCLEEFVTFVTRSRRGVSETPVSTSQSP